MTNYLRKITLERKIIIVSLFFCFFIFSILYFLIIPTINDIKKISQEIELQRIDLEKKYIKGQNLRKMSENLQKIEPKLESLQSVFLDKNNTLSFVTSIEEITAKRKVEQRINLATITEKKDDFLQKTPLQISTEGNFLNQISYLSDLEKLRYYINVQSLEISKSKDTNVKMLIFADTYWR